MREGLWRIPLATSRHYQRHLLQFNGLSRTRLRYLVGHRRVMQRGSSLHNESLFSVPG